MALTFLTESVMSDVKVDEISRANVLVMDTMNQQMLERFNAVNNLDLIGAVRGRGGRCSESARSAERDVYQAGRELG